MNAGDWLLGTVMARLSENAALDPLHVFDFWPERAVLPWAQVEDPVLRADDAVQVTGRVGSIAIIFADGGERPARLRLLMDGVEEQLATLTGEAGGNGWHLASIGLLRTRLSRGKTGWNGRTEWAVRMFRTVEETGT